MGITNSSVMPSCSSRDTTYKKCIQINILERTEMLKMSVNEVTLNIYLL